MVVSYGDLHLSSDRPWSLKVSNDVVDYIINNPLNNENNTLILLGDITDKAIVDGSVTDVLIRFFENLKYKETYICMGNHEGRIKNNIISTTYDFTENEEYRKKLTSKVKIVRELWGTEIEGLKTLFLPHVYAQDGKSLKDYASSQLDTIRETNFDLLVSHLTDSRLPFPTPDKVDISYIKANIKLMGHIHSGEYSDLGYVGSFIPNSVSENDFPRYEVVIENKDSVKKNPLPKLLEYCEVKFPEPLIRTRGKTVVWTFTNCLSENQAKDYYKKDLFIRKCVYSSNIDKEGFKEVLEKSSSIEGFKYYLNDWISIAKDRLNPVLIEKLQYYGNRLS